MEIDQFSVSFQERMKQYIEFSLGDGIFSDYLEIEGKRYYFQKFNDQQTFEVIQEQHRYFNKGEELPISNLFIDPKMPLTELISTKKDIEGLEKILNKVAKREEIKMEQFGEGEQSVLLKLVKNIELQNEKVQQILQQFQEFNAEITLKGRDEVITHFYFPIIRGTKLQNILQFVDGSAGKYIPPLFIRDEYHQQFYQKSFDRSILQLTKARSFVVEYLQPIKITKYQEFLINMLNSTVKQLSVMADCSSTILELVDKVKQKAQDERECTVYDCYNNNIPINVWKQPINKLLLRKPSLLLSFPPFFNFSCSVEVVNLPQGTRTFQYIIQQITTLNDMVIHARKVTKCYAAEFQITDKNSNHYGYQARNKTLFSLKFHCDQLKFTFIPPKCLLRSNTKLIVYNKLQSLEEVPLEALMKSQQVNMLTYNQKTHSVERGTVTCFKTESHYVRLFSLTVMDEEQALSLECFDETTVMTSSFEWKPVSYLKEGEKLMILRKNLKDIVEGKLVKIEKIEVEQKQQLFALQVNPHHNFFASRIVTHNCNTVKVEAYVFSQDNLMQKQVVSCYFSQVIDQIPIFKGKRLEVSGIMLDNKKTMGDYQLSNFGAIFVYPPASIPKTKKYIISSWKERSYQLSEVENDLKLKNMWCSDYLGLHQSNIVELDNNLKSFEAPNRPSQLLIGPREKLQKLQYILNIAPKYASAEDAEIAKFQQAYKLPPHFLNKAKCELKSEYDIYPILIYAHGCGCYEMNKFLRNLKKQGLKQPEDTMRKWFALTNRLDKSLSKLKKYEGITYRGLNNIHPMAFGIKDGQQLPSSIIFQEFVSSSTQKSVAKGFSGGSTGLLFQIKCRSGREIQQYSPYQHEKEVLIPPFTYFTIVKTRKEDGVPVIELEEIPFPRTNKKDLIFWVDDVPSGNFDLIKNFEDRGIQVVQVLSTRIMKVILKDFFGLLQALGKKIVIISDMTRQEEPGSWNSEAGVDLFNIIYQEYGMSITAIIYCSLKNEAQAKIKARGINSDRWHVHTNGSDVLQEVFKQFGK